MLPRIRFNPRVILDRLDFFEVMSARLLPAYVALTLVLGGSAFMVLRDVGHGILRSRRFGEVSVNEQPVWFAIALVFAMIGALVPAAMAFLILRSIAGRLADRLRQNRENPETRAE